MKRRKFIANSMTAVAGTIILPTIVPSSVIGKNPPSDKINIGWIGCGRQGSGDLRATIKFDTAMLVAVADVDSNRAALGKKLIEDTYTKSTGNKDYVNVKTYGDYKELLLDKSIDAVLITTPDHWHAQPAIEAGWNPAANKYTVEICCRTCKKWQDRETAYCKNRTARRPIRT